MLTTRGLWLGLALIILGAPSVARSQEITDAMRADALAAYRARQVTRARPQDLRAKARKRALGAALLAFGMITIPTSSVWIITGGIPDSCLINMDGNCSSEQNARGDASIGTFVVWHLGANAMAAAGNVLLVQGQMDAAGGPFHRHSRAMRIAGGLLVAAAGVMLPLGILQLYNDLADGYSNEQARALGIGLLGVGAAGIPVTAAGAYYARGADSLRVGVSPQASAGADGRTSMSGATLTLSGQF